MEPFRRSHPDSPMYGWSNISADIGGRKYHANYKVVGKELEVCSAYGSKTVELRGGQISRPKAKAEEALREIVHDCQARKARSSRPVADVRAGR